MSTCNPGYCCCGGTCNLSLATVAPNPTVSQAVPGGSKCDGGASCLSTALNSIGKWGASIAGIATGRATTVGANGVAVAPSATNVAATAQAKAAAYLPIILVVAAVIVLIVFLKR